MGRRPLTPDQAAEINLHADAGNAAIGVANGRLAEPCAVAQLALVAPCRPDLVDQVAAIVERGRAVRLADWPPAETTLRLLARVRRVTLGGVALVGPDGVRVTQVTRVARGGSEARTTLRLERHGTLIGEYRNVEALAEHIDLSLLVEELPGEAR